MTYWFKKTKLVIQPEFIFSQFVNLPIIYWHSFTFIYIHSFRYVNMSATWILAVILLGCAAGKYQLIWNLWKVKVKLWNIGRSSSLFMITRNHTLAILVSIFSMYVYFQFSNLKICVRRVTSQIVFKKVNLWKSILTFDRYLSLLRWTWKL